MKTSKITGAIVLACVALGSGYWIGYQHGKSFALANRPRLFASKTRPWPVNAWSAPFGATGGVQVLTTEALAK